MGPGSGAGMTDEVLGQVLDSSRLGGLSARSLGMTWEKGPRDDGGLGSRVLDSSADFQASE